MDSLELAWGERVTQEFRNKIYRICARFRWSHNHASWLMACIAFESAETFSPSIRNGAGSGATGLIQFMPRTARGLGFTTDQLAAMSAVEQLDVVAEYFRPYAHRIKSLEDMYMSILMPKYIGDPPDTVMFRDPTIAYRQNSGLDKNDDGKITVAEAAGKVKDKLRKGFKAGNVFRA